MAMQTTARTSKASRYGNQHDAADRRLAVLIIMLIITIPRDPCRELDLPQDQATSRRRRSIRSRTRFVVSRRARCCGGAPLKPHAVAPVSGLDAQMDPIPSSTCSRDPNARYLVVDEVQRYQQARCPKMASLAPKRI